MRKPSTNNPDPQLVSPKKSPAVPKTETLQSIAADIKSNIRNILLTSPDFPGIYQQVLISEGHNPNQARILAERYQKKLGANMPVQPNVKTCTHIKVTGVRCGSPALRGEQFCYFHQRMVRGVRTPPQSRLHPIALIESEEAIQASLMEVINALARNTIDYHRAQLILRALHIAVKNARRVRFDIPHGNVIKEIPEYQTPQRPETQPATSTPASRGNSSCRDGSSTRPGGVTSPRRTEQKPANESPKGWEELMSELPTTPPRKPPVNVSAVIAKAKERSASARTG